MPRLADLSRLVGQWEGDALGGTVEERRDTDEDGNPKGFDIPMRRR